MGGWRKLVLAGAVSMAMMAAAAPAGAITLVLGSGDLTSFLGVGYVGSFNLNPYMSDSHGRVFQVTSATLSATAHSSPNYGPPVTTTVDTPTGTELNFNPVSVTFDVSRLITTTFTDNHADSLTLATGLGFGQSATGAVSQVLDDTQTSDGGVIDGPASLPFPLPYPANQHTTVTNVVTHHALYGDVDLSFGLDAQGLSNANFGQSVDFLLLAGLDFSIDPSDPFQSFDQSSQFDPASFKVTLDFQRTQIAGPPPDPSTTGVPEPAVWTMMIGGFGLAGAALRRRATRLSGAPRP